MQQTYRPGELTEVVDVLRESATADGMGGNVISTAVVSTVRALVRPLSGREVSKWDQVSAPYLYLFVIRRLATLTEADRLQWRGVQYNIQAIADNGPRSLYVEVTAERQVAQ